MQLSSARSSTLYSFDEDWSYVGIAPGFEYSSFDQYARDYDSLEGDWSLAYRPDTGDSQWLIGLYHRRNQEQLDRNYTYLAAPFSSDYQTDYTALYGQWDYQITPTFEAQVGARYEVREADYSDNAQLQNSTDDGFTSGKLALQWQLNDTHRVYVAVSRGYRAGGVNSTVLASIATAPTSSERQRLQQQQVFDAETLWNTELGLRSFWPELGVTWMTTVFVMDRTDQQVKGSLVLPRADGSTQFIDYINNAAESYNRGLESELRWTLQPSLTLTGSVGILNAKFDRYINADGRDLAGRDQAQAPRFQYAASVHWQPAPQWTITVDLEARDGHYFSDRHETGSDRFERVNTSLTYAMNQWRLVAWAKNLRLLPSADSVVLAMTPEVVSSISRNAMPRNPTINSTPPELLACRSTIHFRRLPMQLTAELSLYPLTECYIEVVQTFINDLERHTGLVIRKNAMSTQISGPSHAVMEAVHQALQTSYESAGKQVLVAKFIPGDFQLDAT
jgi:outer membrane receptor protein involved in Fe transport/uncharacterized protein YqgV (UPF0045/DUF77 family)